MANDIFDNVKKLGFGLMRLPLTNPKDEGAVDIEELSRMVDMFLERGFTYFDTAWMYNAFNSEKSIKKALVERYPREAYTLATKLHSGFIETKEDCDKVFNRQLENTGVGYFDYYLIHDVNSFSCEVYDRLDVWSWLADKKKDGLVRHTGFSFHDTPQLLEKVLAAHPEMEFVQLQLNYLDYESQAVRSRECYEIACKYNKPVVVMEPVKGGTLVNVPEEIKDMFGEYAPNMSVASWAVRFAASHDNVKMVLSGMSNLSQLDDNTSYMQEFVPLNEDEKDIINKAVSILQQNAGIPCTGCSYCTPGCPMKIAIPKYFSVYNAEKMENPNGDKPWTSEQELYTNLTKSFGKASDCIHCRRCESMCPQHLHINDYLEEIARYFE